jgi:hypothetical protein
MVTPDEQRTLQLANAKAAAAFWEGLHGGQTATVEGHKGLVATTAAIPATSNVACGFPALRFPVRFAPRLMGPILLGQLQEQFGVSAPARWSPWLGSALNMRSAHWLQLLSFWGLSKLPIRLSKSH